MHHPGDSKYRGIYMILDIILDVNIPKKVKKMNNGTRVLHIGDVDTTMSDDDILHITSKFNSLIVTHDRKLALRASKKYRALYLKRNLSAQQIATCLDRNKKILKHASLFCSAEDCSNCS